MSVRALYGVFFFEAFMKKKLIIWDFDGVIADTEKLWLKNRQILLKKELGLDWDWETINHYLHGTADNTKRKILDSLGIKTNDDFWKKCIAMDTNTINSEGFLLTPDIEQIFKMREIRQCIATGGTKEKTALKINHIGIRKYFPDEKVFTIDMVEKGKPEPDIFLLAAKKMGFLPQESVVIEDSLAGLTAAIKAGCTPIAFLGGDLKSNEQYYQKVKKLGVNLIFNNMNDVKNQIKELF